MIDHKSHFSRYCDLMALAASSAPARQQDGGYMAALYILSADKELHNLARSQISADGISFSKLHKSILRAELSNSQITAAKAAHSLFNNGSRSITPLDLSQCDYATLDILTNALYIWKCGRVLSGGDGGEIRFDTATERRSRCIEGEMAAFFASVQEADENIS